MNDLWKHRSTNMRCLTCMWFLSKDPESAEVGRCRRHAPTMNGYPVVFTNDWCGDHKLDEARAWVDEGKIKTLDEMERKTPGAIIPSDRKLHTKLDPMLKPDTDPRKR